MRVYRANNTTKPIRLYREYRSIAIVLVLISTLSAAVVVAEELEPNDTFATATTTGLAGLGSITVTDAILGNGEWADRDVDLYSLELDSTETFPVRLTVDLTGLPPDASFDPYLRLFDNVGTQIATNDDRGSDDVNSRIETYLLEAGIYYVGVSSAQNPHYDPAVENRGRAGSTGSYTLTVSTGRGVSSKAALEPNDVVSGATELGDSLCDWLNNDFCRIPRQFIGDGENLRKDVDIYRVSVDAPARVDVSVEAVGIGSVLDPAVRVSSCAARIEEPTYGDPCGLGESDDRPDGSVDAALSVGVNSATEVYVFVSGAGNRRYDPAEPGSGEPGSVGYYDLTIRITPFSGDGPYEPNDSILTAALDTYGSGSWPAETTVLHGFIGDGPFHLTRGDRDFYQLLAIASGPLLVDVEPLGESDLEPVLAVYDITGHRVAVGEAYGDSGGRRLMIPAQCAGRDDRYEIDRNTLFVMVTGARQRFPNDPLVPWPTLYGYGPMRYEEHWVENSQGSTGAYELTLRFRRESCGTEPDATHATATDTGIVDDGAYLCSEGGIGDALCENSLLDVDQYSVTVENPPVLLTVALYECVATLGDFNGNFRVFDSQGQEIDQYWWNDYYGRIVAEVQLDSADTYYIAVSDEHYDDYDPTIACSGSTSLWSYPFRYDLAIELTRLSPGPYLDKGRVGSSLTLKRRTLTGPDSAVSVERSPRTVAGAEALLFAARADGELNAIDVLDPQTGQITASFSAPEASTVGAQGMAYDGGELLYIGTGKYPTLYRLFPNSGVVIDQYILGHGSGHYSGATLLGGWLYLLDFVDGVIHVVDPVGGRWRRSLPVGAINGISTAGGLASLNDPARLYMGDAYDRGMIFEIDPVTGAVTGELETTGNRPTSLGGDGDSGRLFVADWASDSLEVTDRAGNPIASFPVDYPVELLAGKSFAGSFADCDNDGFADGFSFSMGASLDCNGNGIPDECDVVDGASEDCNANSIPDECEDDCNANGVPDDCDTWGGASVDCNENEIPDECEADCNGNEVQDLCDIADGTSLDADHDGIPDECERVLLVDDDAPGGGRGSSWSDPLSDLPQALAIASNRESGVSEIRVAQGVYTPGAPGERRATFQLVSGVAVYGGYAGYDSPCPDDRDTTLYPSILSGDSLGDDDPDAFALADNVYHVVTTDGVEATAVLDGFTIQGGYANGLAWRDRFGAGIYNDGGNPTIRDCVITRNNVYATLSVAAIKRGAGMFNDGGSPTLIDCTFAHNSAAPNLARPFEGGAMYNLDSNLTLIHCTLVDNTAPLGSGMVNDAGSAVLIGCSFFSNDAVWGGALWNKYSDVHLSNCLFAGNDAGTGASAGPAHTKPLVP